MLNVTRGDYFMNMSSAPLQDQAYDILKEKILNDEFHANVMYSETKLARELSISRTPLRNALRGLEQDGYIIIAPSRGFMIRSLDKQGLKQSIEIRSAIEGYCVYRAAEDEHSLEKKKLINNLDSILSEMELLVKEDGKAREYTKLDQALHLEILEYVGNPFQLAEIQRIYYLMSKTTRASLKIEGRMKSTNEEHKAIVKAIKNNNPQEAYQTMMNHLSAPLQILDIEG